MSSKQRVVIVGGGIMGADIAAIFAAGGHAVDIVQRSGARRDTLAQRFTRALAQLGAGPAVPVVRESLREVSWHGVGIVVESVRENLTLKQRLFAELDTLAPVEVILASNSSSFPISKIAAGLHTRQRMLNLHFFMPAHVVPLVEIVKSEATDPQLAARVFDLMTSLGRKPVMVAKDIPGFLANRIQHAMMREAWSLIERGIASAEDVDTAVRFGFGFRFIAAGPILQKELSGLDVHLDASTAMYPDLCNDTAPIASLKNKVAAGDLGMKSGKGFYAWTPEKAAAVRRDYDSALEKGLEILKASNDSR
ncbi:MAG: 3-hydroxyacyl-CoA dehydrogenase NAD-binding domain-containing protein [Burkholderiales bacterium]